MEDNDCEDEGDCSRSREPRFVDLRSKEAEIFNQLLDCHIPEDVIRWDCYREIGWVFELEDLVVDVENTAADAVTVRVTSGSLPRVHIDPLRQELRRMLYSALTSQDRILDFAITLLRIVETAVVAIQEWKYDQKSEGRAKANRLKGWNAQTVSNQAIFDNPYGVDLDTVDDSAFHLLGKSVKQLCDAIELDSADQFHRNFANNPGLMQVSDDRKFRIVHVENVLRQDLVSRFRRRQRQMLDQVLRCTYREVRECVSQETIPRGSVLDNQVDLARELCKPRATYHGTSRWNVSSIVRWGFVLPGQTAGNSTIGTAFGASFGKGIYTSPDANYALSYSKWSEEFQSWEKTSLQEMPGLRLIICAVLMGRPIQVTRDATRQTTTIANQSAHSHVSPNLCEYIVFDSAQIVPCYVVHLDLGLEVARIWLKFTPDDKSAYKKNKTHPKFLPQGLFPGEVKDLKLAKKAAASKWFPYGYGPATGTSFVIEEIGEVSDDEENYGDYQKEKVEFAEEEKPWFSEEATSGSWFDEYQTSRRL